MSASWLYGVLTGLGVKGCDMDIAVFLNLDKYNEDSEVPDDSIFTLVLHESIAYYSLHFMQNL